MAFFRPRLLSADESGSASARLGLPLRHFSGRVLRAPGLWPGWNWRPDDGSRWAVRLAEWLNGDVTAGTFREPLRLTDRRARAADRQENRPTFTGWSGYPTHLVVCDRDGMTVRAADHRDNTSVRMTSRLSSVVKRPHRCACLGAAVAVPGRHTETIAEGVDDDDEPDEDRDRTGQEGT